MIAREGGISEGGSIRGCDGGGPMPPPPPPPYSHGPEYWSNSYHIVTLCCTLAIIAAWAGFVEYNVA